MHLDRNVKYVLTVIAIGIWVLILTQVGFQPFMARAEATESNLLAAPNELAKGPSGGTSSQQRFWAAQPLRWRVSSFQELVDPANATYCSTVVSVRNVARKSTGVQVEWYNWNGVSKGIRSLTLPPGREVQFASDNQINLRPFVPENDANLGNMYGYAKVHANHARILVTANLVCRDGTASDANLVAIKGIPTSPVGRTMGFF